MFFRFHRSHTPAHLPFASAQCKASMWMRNHWNNHIDNPSNGYFAHQVRGQTLWMFHLLANNLEDSHATTLNTGQPVSIHSMHFIFPFCPLEVGYIVIPILKNTWEIEANRLSDFSPFLPLRVHSFNSLWNFFKTTFTLRNLIAEPKSSLLDRAVAEFIFPNTTFIIDEDKRCFCCELNLVYNSSLGSIERFESFRHKYRGDDFKLPVLETADIMREILQNYPQLHNLL